MKMLCFLIFQRASTVASTVASTERQLSVNCSANLTLPWDFLRAHQESTKLSQATWEYLKQTNKPAPERLQHSRQVTRHRSKSGPESCQSNRNYLAQKYYISRLMAEILHRLIHVQVLVGWTKQTPHPLFNVDKIRGGEGFWPWITFFLEPRRLQY